MSAATLAIEVDRLLAAPGRSTEQPNRRITVAEGRITAIEAGGGGTGLLALPPLANAHDHGRGLRPVAFGALDDALEAWIPALRLEPLVDPYRRAAVAFGRMALVGIAATNHCHNTQRPDRLIEEAAGVARAAADVGIRVAFAVPIADRNPFVYGDTDALAALHAPADWALVRPLARGGTPAETQLAAVEAIAAHESPWFQVQYGPIGPQWVEDATLARIAAASAGSGRRVHMHLLETRRQREWADATYPHGLVRHLDALGLLSERLTVAHGVWLREDEAGLLAERGVTLSVNTSSNLRLRSGTAPVAMLRRAGVRLGLGLDGAALDDDEDPWRELRLAWWLHAGTDITPGWSVRGLWEAACDHGHASCGAPVPAIEVGAPADLALLDLATIQADAVTAEPPTLPFLLARARARHVQGLLVGGREVVRDGRLTGIDLTALEAELLAEARAAGPPIDPGLVARHQDAIRQFYGQGRHRGGGA